ncbi:antibiotic biosynthesis monooxygenase [uncultured Lactobacillus sp.]|uniref:putative quinol monooxygenase n=1 Tax=uncultured Lactobacillus sp. TaxID=153152 RepID=UPI00260EB9A3|nr:antibiotic biosynthesis monooxygenase [uncultured Lactobacillus sp.]
MKLEQAPILRLYKLETSKADHAKFIEACQQNMLNSQANEAGTLFMQTSHDEETTNFMVECYQDEASYEIHDSSPQFKQFISATKGLLTNRVAVKLFPEFISTKAENLSVSGPNNYVIYLTEIGVSLGKGDEFAHAVMKEMKTAVEEENDILAMIAGTIENQPNEWLAIEVYRNNAAYEKHLQTKNFKEYLNNTKYCVESKSLRKLQSDVIVDQGEIFYQP